MHFIGDFEEAENFRKEFTASSSGVDDVLDIDLPIKTGNEKRKTSAKDTSGENTDDEQDEEKDLKKLRAPGISIGFQGLPWVKYQWNNI